MILFIASGPRRYLNSAHRRVYICLCDSPIIHRLAGQCEKYIWWRKKRRKRQYTYHNSFNYSFQGNCQQMLFFCVFCLFHGQSLTGLNSSVHDQRDDNTWQGEKKCHTSTLKVLVFSEMSEMKMFHPKYNPIRCSRQYYWIITLLPNFIWWIMEIKET